MSSRPFWRLLPLIVIATLAVVGLGGVADATTVSSVASADTFVNSNSAGTSYGANTLLRVNHGTVEKISYVKFSVSGIPSGETVSSASLQLTSSADAQNADTLDVYAVDNSWTESTTYNTRPTLGAKVATVAVSGPNQTVSVNVPVSGNGTVSFALWKTTSGNGDSVLASSEHGTTAARPKLTVNSGTVVVPPADDPLPSANAAATSYGFTNCDTLPTTRPFPAGTVLTSQWKVGSPPSTQTYDLSGVTSTAYPATASPFATGTSTPPSKTCLSGGKIEGTTDDAKGWSYYHDTYNASCVRMVGTQQLQVRDLRCHDIEDGLKFLENNNSVGNSNTTSFFSSGTYLSRVRDDCIENDFTLGGVLYDSLWDGCNTGISERPADANGTWTSPSTEKLVLDHMLIGLWKTWHEADGKSGENALFKWSSSANKLVIKCSIFKVDSVSLNGASSNDIPAGTTVDDSACPNNPSTIVWLGGGSYPGNLNGSGLRVTSDVSVWNNAVAAWKTSHGY